MRRSDPIIASFASVVEPHSRVLDIGAGKGHLARQLAEQFHAHVTMVDVAQYNETDLPLAICDSRALAFADAQFDMALLSFVLHHSPNPEGILSEALRVAPRVVVVENHVKGRLRAAITRIVDSWPAIRYGTPPCYFTRNREAWLDFFRGFPVQTRPLGEFSGEFGFFDCFTVELSRSARCDRKP